MSKSDRENERPPGSGQAEPSAGDECREADQESDTVSKEGGHENHLSWPAHEKTPLEPTEEIEPTETLDIGKLFVRDLSDSGSFDIRGEIWSTTFGKVLQALPIPAILLNQYQTIWLTNEGCGRITPDYETIQGLDFSAFFPDAEVRKRVETLVDEVFRTRRPSVIEGVMSFGATRIWARLSLRSIRLMKERYVLVLLEDLTAEKRQLQENKRLREALERRVAERTAELLEANEDLRREISERLRVEEALNEQKIKLENLAENSPFGMVMIAPDGTYLYVNPKFKELFGYELSDVPDIQVWFGKAFPEQSCRKEAIEMWIEDVSRMERGQAAARILKISCKDRGQKVVHFRYVHLPTGEHLMTCEDITERVRAEEQLRIYRERLEALLNATTDVAILIDSEGKILALNQEAATRLGSRVPDLLGHCLFDLFPPEMSFTRRDRSKKVLSSGRPIREEETGLNGSTYDTSEYPAFSADGQVEGVAIFARDITDQRRAEEQLRASEDKYRNILETIADGYHEVDLVGNLILFNDSLCDILGYSREELLGKNYRQLLDSDTATRVQRAYDQVYATGIPNPDFGFEIVRKDRSRRHVSVSISMMRNAAGELSGFRGICRDVTVRKRLEEQLQQAAKMEAIGRLAGGIAHDFNNLLTAVMGYTTLLKQEISQDSVSHSKLVQISKATERAAGLTKQLLAFSRKQVLEVKVLDLNQIILGLQEMLRRLIGEDIHLKVVCSPSLGSVEADPVQIEQMLINFAVNARDAMPNGGTLNIETDTVLFDEAYASAHPEVEAGAYVMLAVSDSGCGMDRDTVSRIFDPFFTTKSKEAGTGLGLATVYGIVKQHRGHIAVHSEPGRGTIFQVYLPRIEDVPEPAHVVSATELRPEGRETVLVVEDEDVVKDLVCEALEMFGYRVLTASSPGQAQAISEGHQGPIHILLTDVVLPEMDGKSLYESLVAKRPEIKALYVSGHTENFIVHHGVLDRGVHFLPKPFTIEALMRRMREVLDGS